MGTIDLSNSNLSDRDLVASAGKGLDGPQEEVVVKATGRAIEKALNIALYFQKQDDCKAVLRTGEVGAVDDIEVDGEESARVRKASVLEVGITLI
jgi:ribonuclease P/MRP protein subunit POP7